MGISLIGPGRSRARVKSAKTSVRSAVRARPAAQELKGDPGDSPLSGDSLIGKTWDEAASRVGGPPGDR